MVIVDFTRQASGLRKKKRIEPVVKVLLYSVKNCEDSESVAYLKYNKLACHNFVGAGKKTNKQINMIFLDQRPRALLL